MKLIKRKVDQLGRIVIPSDIRELFNIQEGDELGFELLPDGFKVVKYYATCTLCDADSLLVDILMDIGTKSTKKLCYNCFRKAKIAFQEFDSQ